MRPRERQRAGGRVAKFERSAAEAAKRAGLFLMPDGKPAERKWSFFCTATGRWLMDYHPVTRVWTAGKEHGGCAAWEDAVRLAAARKPSTAPRPG